MGRGCLPVALVMLVAHLIRLIFALVSFPFEWLAAMIMQLVNSIDEAVDRLYMKLPHGHSNSKEDHSIQVLAVIIVIALFAIMMWLLARTGWHLSAPRNWRILLPWEWVTLPHGTSIPTPHR